MLEGTKETDWKTFAAVTAALWPDRRDAERQALETVAAVSLLALTPDRTLERATSALLQRAGHQPAFSAETPYFRLAPEERLILIALYSGRWSYPRLAKILGESEEWIQEIA